MDPSAGCNCEPEINQLDRIGAGGAEMAGVHVQIWR